MSQQSSSSKVETRVGNHLYEEPLIEKTLWNCEISLKTSPINANSKRWLRFTLVLNVLKMLSKVLMDTNWIKETVAYIVISAESRITVGEVLDTNISFLLELDGHPFSDLIPNCKVHLYTIENRTVEYSDINSVSFSSHITYLRELDSSNTAHHHAGILSFDRNLAQDIYQIVAEVRMDGLFYYVPSVYHNPFSFENVWMVRDMIEKGMNSSSRDVLEDLYFLVLPLYKYLTMSVPSHCASQQNFGGDLVTDGKLNANPRRDSFGRGRGKGPKVGLGDKPTKTSALREQMNSKSSKGANDDLDGGTNWDHLFSTPKGERGQRLSQSRTLKTAKNFLPDSLLTPKRDSGFKKKTTPRRQLKLSPDGSRRSSSMSLGRARITISGTPSFILGSRVVTSVGKVGGRGKKFKKVWVP